MAALLNFGGACTYKLKNTKTIGDKLNLINNIDHNISVSAMRY